MQYQLITKKVHCPYCGEGFETVIDTSMVDTEYTEDCYVCCRPIIFSVFSDEFGYGNDNQGSIDVTLRTEND